MRESMPFLALISRHLSSIDTLLLYALTKARTKTVLGRPSYPTHLFLSATSPSYPPHLLLIRHISFLSTTSPSYPPNLLLIRLISFLSATSPSYPPHLLLINQISFLSATSPSYPPQLLLSHHLDKVIFCWYHHSMHGVLFPQQLPNIFTIVIKLSVYI